MGFTVFRLDKSQYQSNQFLIDEKKALEAIPSIKYTNVISSLSQDEKIILLSTSQTNIRSIPKLLLKNSHLLIHPNSGWDNFDDDFVKNNSFPMITGNSIRSAPVCEYILSCLFNFFNPIRQDHHWDESRQWSRALIRDQKILIYGHGHIGKMVFDSLTPIVQKLFVVDPYVFKENNKNKLNSINEDFLSTTDVVILCNDLNKKSKFMINDQFFSKLKKPFLIINGARGKLIQQESLIRNLQRYPSSFAYLDVFEKEPFTPGDFLELKNLNKTSHIAGVHDLLNKDIIKFEKNVIEDFLDAHTNETLKQFDEKYKNYNMKNRLQIYDSN